MNVQKDQDKKKYLIQELQSLQSPFTWKFFSLGETHDYIIKATNLKIEEIEEENEFRWRTFILTLVLCYEYYSVKDNRTAWEKLNTCKEVINSVYSKGIYEAFYKSTRDALFHIVYACECQLFIEDGSMDKAEETLGRICKEVDMNNTCKAALYGIKAAVSVEYGYEGVKNSILYVKEAIRLDEKQAEWQFLLGKCLARIRRIEHHSEMPTSEELKALENAINMLKNPSYMIFLADSYAQATFSINAINDYKLDPDQEKVTDGMNKMAKKLFSDALDLRRDCAHVNIRCAKGLYRLPPPYKDVEKAKACAQKALQLAPDNVMINQFNGKIHEDNKDYEKAKEYYKKCTIITACYGPNMDLFRLEYIMDNSYDPIPQMEELSKKFPERKESLLCEMGSYYFFIKNDIATAYTKYWKEVIDQNPQSEKLKTHKCMFLKMKKFVSVYELLYNEAHTLLKCSEAKKENTKLYRHILCVCEKCSPDLDQMSPKPLRKNILDEASRAQFRGGGRRGRGRGRGRSSNRWAASNEGTEKGTLEGKEVRVEAKEDEDKGKDTFQSTRRRGRGGGMGNYGREM